jgi:hypothetical protein
MEIEATRYRFRQRSLETSEIADALPGIDPHRA